MHASVPAGAPMICLLPHCSYLSETSRMLAIRRALLARGARVTVATHGGTHERLLRQFGVPYDIVGPAMTEERSRSFVHLGPGIGAPSQSMWTDEELRAYVEAEARYFAEREVQIAVTGFTLTALLSTRLAGIPLAAEHAGSFVPPMWERGRLEAPISPFFPGSRWLPRPARRWLANLGTNRTQIYCSGFNRVARALGVEGVPSFAQLLLADVTIVPEIPDVLGLTADELTAWRPTQPGYRSSTRLVPGGPIYAELDLPLPERVESFLAGGGPVVYVALTSTTAHQVRGIVSALRSLGVKLLVAATVHDLADLEGDNVMVEGVLPSQLVMPRVDLAVTMGGQGSVQCAMAAGTPLVAVPLHPEQDLNVSLIERLGAGHRIAMADAVSPRLGAHVRRVMEQPTYRAAAGRIAAAYSRVDGPGMAADAILSSLTEHRP